jgi:hypothetical protein
MADDLPEIDRSHSSPLDVIKKRTNRPPRNNIDEQDFDVWHSRPLDVHRWSDFPEVNQLVDRVYDELGDEQKVHISGSSNNSGKASGKTHLKVVLLDLYVAWKNDPDMCLGVALGSDAYKVDSRYNAIHISRRVKNVIEALEASDLIHVRVGSHNRSGDTKGNRTTRIKATSLLEMHFEGLEVEPYAIRRHQDTECIILNDVDTDAFGEPILTKKGKKKSKPVEYQNSPETNQWREELTAYNNLLEETYIDIFTLAEPIITREKSNGDIQKIGINQNGKFVRRVFSRGDWATNGRFYGGWWQQIGEELRRDITINNLPTVEVDYKGLHASILAAEVGMYDKNKDIYNLGEQILPQFDMVQQREIVKGLVLTAINAKTKKAAFSAFRQDRDTGTPEKKLTNKELEQYLTKFIQLHPYLEDKLCSDQGVRLMFLDSQITAQIINNFVKGKKPILSVHDSYIVQTTDVDLLRSEMKKASLDVVGTDLSIVQEIPSYDDIIRMQRLDRDRYLDTFKEILSMKKKTIQYEDRLSVFITFRKKYYPDTYWLFHY